MREVFADTGYWVAMLNPQDQWHSRAAAAARGLGEFRTVTSEMVMAEFLNFSSRYGPFIRKAASDTVDWIRQNPHVDLVPQTSLQFRAAHRLYSERLDKAWSLTDCSSILIMQERQIIDILTADEHFQQAGLNPLLRDH